VNNPTLEEADLALEQGATGCTTNPAFGGNLLKRAPVQIQPVIAAVLREIDDDELVAEEVQRRLVERILLRFRRIFDSSDGKRGFVSLQGPPEADTTMGPILASAERARQLAPNCVPKIPATAPGLEAFSVLVAEGEPTIVTEVFSLAQVVAASERYVEITARTGRRPPFIMSPITGIFGDHLRVVAERKGVTVDRAMTDWAGVAFAREAARVVAGSRYPVTLLFGGARTPVDLTGLVGDGHCATINWSTFVDILDLNPECRETIHDETDPAVCTALAAAFDDFRRALDVDALSVNEFEGFGPVQHFRNNFIAGWRAVLAEIRAERAGIAATA
jgi:transaldolase